MVKPITEPVTKPDKQVCLKFLGSLDQPELTVELQIFKGGDRNHPLALLSQIVLVEPALCQQVTELWQRQYRALVKGRALKNFTIETQHITHQSCIAAAETVDTSLNDWLQTPEFQPLRDALLRELNPEERIQILVQSRDRTLQQLPWPRWRLLDNYPHATISQSAPDLKRLPEKPEAHSGKLRILGIFGDQRGIDTTPDRQLLQGLPTDQVDVQILDQPDRAQLNDQLWEQAWDMILFAGHGDTVETAQGGQEQGLLYLNGTGETLTFNEIWYGLRKAVNEGLQLFLLNSCAGLGLLARNLQEDAQLPHLIVMRDWVPDAVAAAFLRYFLTAFVAGNPVDQAVQTARQRLQGLETDYPCASLLPVLWQNPYAQPFGLGVLKPRQSGRSRLIFTGIGIVLVGTVAFWGLRAPIADWFYRQGQAADQWDEYLLAKRNFTIAAAINPNDVYSRYMLGFIHDEVRGDINSALSWYEEAAVLGMPEAIAEYVRLQLLQSQTDGLTLSEADVSRLLKYTKLCLDKTPYSGTKASCLKNRGWIAAEQGRWAKAAKDLRAAIALRDDSPHTHCLLAQALEHQGEVEQAQVHWHKTSLQSEAHILEQGLCLREVERRSS
ncbi:MAG: CHAT domain-containing protein [Cyanobacteria bacterium P01_G01_bin.54]